MILENDFVPASRTTDVISPQITQVNPVTRDTNPVDPEEVGLELNYLE